MDASSWGRILFLGRFSMGGTGNPGRRRCGATLQNSGLHMMHRWRSLHVLRCRGVFTVPWREAYSPWNLTWPQTEHVGLDVCVSYVYGCDMCEVNVAGTVADVTWAARTLSRRCFLTVTAFCACASLFWEMATCLWSDATFFVTTMSCCGCAISLCEMAVCLWSDAPSVHVCEQLWQKCHYWYYIWLRQSRLQEAVACVQGKEAVACMQGQTMFRTAHLLSSVKLAALVCSQH